MSPSLFILYINDIVTVAQSIDIKINIFATDTSIFSARTLVRTTISTIQEVLDWITAWTTNNKFKLNCDKTKAMFRPRNKMLDVLPCVINNEEI